MRGRAAVSVVTAAALATAVFLAAPGSDPSQKATVAPEQTGCHVRGPLPDRRCTPGASDRRVTQANIDGTICRRGYSKSVRPPTSVTRPIKRERIAAYGLPSDPRLYELDHLVSLELGGAPANPANLWPEAYVTSSGARTKDRIENRLHSLVCRHEVPLRDAQRAIATDWVRAYHRYVETD
jgi:hypothetical protein